MTRAGSSSAGGGVGSSPPPSIKPRMASDSWASFFSLLAEQSAFESLVFFTQVRVQLLVLVALALSFLQSFEPSQ